MSSVLANHEESSGTENAASSCQEPGLQKIMRENKKDRSPLVVAIALAVGLLAQVLGGPLAGIAGAVIGATASGVFVRVYHEDHAH